MRSTYALDKVYLVGCGPVIGFVDSRIRGLKTTPKNEHFRITSKTKSGRPISPPWQDFRRFEVVAPKNRSKPKNEKRSRLALINHSNTRNHGCHRRPCRYPRAPRHRAQGARRAHPPRLHLQRCQGRAAQGTRGPSDPLSRKNTASRRVRYFSSSRLASARASRATVAPAGRNQACGARVARAVSLRGVPVRAILFRASRDPRQARIRTGRVPASPLFPPTSLPWRSWKHRRAAFLFFAERERESL